MDLKKNRSVLVLLALIPLTLALAGCGSDQTGSPAQAKDTGDQIPVSHVPPPLDGGWTLATLQSDGFAIGLPPGWVKFDMSQADMQNAFAEIGQSNPALANALSGQVAQLAAQGVKLYAVDQYGSFASTGFATNLNVIKVAADGNTSLDDMSKQATDEIKQQFNTTKPITFFKNRLNINSGEAERIQYNLDLNMPSGKSVTASFTQYIALYNDDAYIATYTTTDGEFAQYSELFDKSAKTLTFLDNN